MTKSPLWHSQICEHHLHNNLFDIRVIDELSSTNGYLLDEVKHRRIVTPSCIVALNQTNGRGRQGRRWLSDSKNSLTFSVNYLFNRSLTESTSLPLVVALAIYDALNALHIDDIGIKWPNDILRQQKKLAGILVECANRTQHSSELVIGIGLNVGKNHLLQENVDQPLADCTNTEGVSPSREELLALLLNHLSLYFKAFDEEGFHQFKERWLTHCLHFKQQVALTLPDGSTTEGLHVDILEDGSILVRHDATLSVFHSGEIRLRSIA